MAMGNIHGRARVDPRSPEAFAECDDCGFWFNRVDLVEAMEYFGNALKWTGYLVCRRCNDKPQDQLRPPILPVPDPRPIINPRVEGFSQDFALFGFTQFTIVPALTVGDGKAAVLAAVAKITGIATPGSIADQSGVIATKNKTQTMVAANATRTWILLYNPTSNPYAVSLGQAVFGGRDTIMVGPGNALFWASQPQIPPPATGAVTIIGYMQNAAYWAWDSSAAIPPVALGPQGGGLFITQGGQLIVVE